MRDSERYVHYKIAADIYSLESVKHAIFELSCRVGILFKISEWDRDTIINDEPDTLQIYFSLYQNNEYSIQIHNEKTIITLQNDSCLIGSHAETIGELISSTEYMLKFVYEENAERDSLGRINPFQNKIFSTLNAPLLEKNSSNLKTILLELDPMLTVVDKPWGNKCLISITHDIDGPFLKDMFSLFRSFFYAIRGNKKEKDAFIRGFLARMFNEIDPYEMFSEWLSVGRNWGAQTFYLYPGKLQKVKQHKNDPHYELNDRLLSHMNNISKQGHEIALHSGILCESRSDFEESKLKLEECLDVSISGVRGHYWSGVWKEPIKHWKELHEIGFKYDSTLNPLDLGFRSGISLPIVPSFRYSEDLSNAFVVLPTAIMDAYIVRHRDTNSNHILETIKSCSENGLCILDWHLRVLSNIGPWKGYPNELFEILKILTDETELLFLSTENIAKYWLSYVNKCYIKNSI